ncbi:uncharacterized protein LOC111881132 [Lactuca sativa]|uniref:uncharacterized protein LOC111881132 n=1 Tax=Lactuca sativa TaxID=4236 RepID=UPI000CD9BE99|nr:uncharacterized protein LOC111881132 [Lactuca sativa]
MAFGTKLIPSVDKPAAYITLYRQMIGSLLYLTSSRPDIMFAVCYCERFQSNPREPHMMALKNIFRYLCKTTSLGLWYPSNYGFFVQRHILMLILEVVVFIAKVLLEGVSSWMVNWLVGNQRNKLASLYQPQKLNISQQLHVLCKSSGYKVNVEIMA